MSKTVTEQIPTIAMLNGGVEEVYFTEWTFDGNTWTPTATEIAPDHPVDGFVFELPIGCYQLDVIMVAGDVLDLSPSPSGSGDFRKCERPRTLAQDGMQAVSM